MLRLCHLTRFQKPECPRSTLASMVTVAGYPCPTLSDDICLFIRISCDVELKTVRPGKMYHLLSLANLGCNFYSRTHSDTRGLFARRQRNGRRFTRRSNGWILLPNIRTLLKFIDVPLAAYLSVGRGQRVSAELPIPLLISVVSLGYLRTCCWCYILHYRPSRPFLARRPQ
ncbi:hypothetical protein BS17DRAFT_563998 [Gyrodon lividus]|nr:hypothetical protein BS17DRAFT_563998 [Gyrodon lividus]